MNKAIQKMMLALAMCGTLCGTAMAAPKGNPPPKGKAPTAMKAPAEKPRAAKAPTPARHVAKAPAKTPPKAHFAPTRPAQRHEIARHAPPPPPPPPRAKHHEPKHRHHNDCHCNGTLHTEDWCEVGASLLGGLIGGLIGAAI